MEIEVEEPKRNNRVPTPLRWRIVHSIDDGVPIAEVARLRKVPGPTCRSLYARYLETGDVADRPRPGAPKKITPEVQELIIHQTLVKPDLTLDQIIEETKVDISRPTAWKVLKDNGFEYKPSKVKWTLTEDHRRQRLAWAKHYIKMPEEYWFQVVFTDECTIQRNTKKKKWWVPKESEVPATQVARWGPTANVWGCITIDGVSALEVFQGTMTSERYLDILRRKLMRNLPTLNPVNVKGKDSKPLIWQQDGASYHVTDEVYRVLGKRNITILPWPPKSPDLNLIESVWALLKNRLKNSYETREDLVEDIVNVWYSIQSKHIVNLYSSMKDRIQAVIDAKGGPTDY
jgi:transposase